jgi:SHS2 domain-containing protein
VEGHFEEIEHTADLAIRVWGSDLQELFANAAYGMACQLANVDSVEAKIERRVAIEAADLEILLVEWLSELLYLGERDRVVFTEFDVFEVTSNKLEAKARGGPVEELQGHIKAVTFSELDIKETDRGYETIIVFDV